MDALSDFHSDNFSQLVSRQKTATSTNSTFIEDLDLENERNLDTDQEFTNLVLTEQLRNIKDENGRLLKLVAEKEHELKKVKKKLADSSEILAMGGSGVTGDVAAAKIIELSKKLREMSSESNKHSNKCKALAKQLHDKDHEIQIMQSEISSLSALQMGSGKKSSAKSSEKQSSEKQILAAANAKVLEVKAQLEAVRLELKKTQRALTSEVGKDYSVQEILSGSSGWRGRQQKIIDLQNKLNEIKASQSNNFDQYRNTMTARSMDTIEEEFMGMSTSGSLATPPSNPNSKYREHLRTIERKRRDEIEQLTKEVHILNEEKQKLNLGMESAKARSKTLSSEVKTLRLQIQHLKEKSSHDNELITVLMSQLDQLKTAIASKKKENLEEPPPPIKKSAAQQQVEAAIVDQLKAVISEKEKRIKEMETELIQSQTAIRSSSTSKLTPIPSLQRSVTFSTKADIISSYSSLSDCPSQSITEDASKSSVEDKSCLAVLEIERDKLTELCSVLRQRIDDLQERNMSLEKEVSQQKRRCVQMEKQLGHASLNKSSLFMDSDGDCNEMQTKIEIQQDEIQSLQNNLRSIMKARDDDFALYKDMVQQTKTVFLQALRQYKSKSE